MSLITISDGYVCTDCMFMIANGELESEASEASEARIQEVANATARWCLDDSEYADNEFSWAPCRTCRSRLGGARHWAVLLGEGTPCK